MASRESCRLIKRLPRWVGRVMWAEKEFGVEGELEVVGLCATWRNCMCDVHEVGGREEVRGKSSLKWYRLANKDFG